MSIFRTSAMTACAVLVTCILISAANGQGVVVNIDVGNDRGTYSGQGIIDDTGNAVWNGITTTGSNLLASDGTPTGVSISLTSAGKFDYDNSNTLLADYQYVTTFFGPQKGTITLSGLQADTSYLIYTFSAGDNIDQAGYISLNGVSGLTSGSTSDQFEEGANYLLLEVQSDVNGVIAGTWEPYRSYGAINGFQVVEGSLPPRVIEIAGAESPTVHSPNDAIVVTLNFSDDVTLSQLGGAALDLDIDGTIVTAVHKGATMGRSLTFEAIAPSVTTMNTKVIADSLRLLGTQTLVAGTTAVQLGHDDVPLPNDQISVHGLSVYPHVPDLDQSPHYRFRVRELGGSWQSSFAWFTRCIDDAPIVPYGYYNQFIGGWSHSYCNFEMANNVPAEIEITRLDPQTGRKIDIKKAVPHPRRKVKSWRVSDGKAYVTIERPTLFAVDIDGQMDENPTPSSRFINETALHGVSIFANPFILDKPDLNDPDVLAVDPGTIPPDNGTWKTLYFKPGVHQIFPGNRWAVGDDFRLRSNKSYYIPGDAIVHGNFNNRDDDADGQSIRIFGHGTLSGERVDHYVELGMTEDDSWQTRPIRVANDAKGCRVEGLTIADPANHSCTLVAGFNVRPEDLNYVRWCKAISWRANGDGISPNGSGYAEDCFLRTQDDGTYVIGLGIRRMVYWHDVNGMPLRCDFLTARNQVPFREKPLLVEDIDVIYARTGFGSGAGRSVIGYPLRADAVPNNTGSHVIFRDINVEDPFPTRILFGWDLGLTIDDDTGMTAVGALSGVRFENIRAAAPAVDGTKDILRGDAVAPIQGLIFDNVTLAGEHYKSFGDFDSNAQVSGLGFQNTAPETMTYRNTSGYGKWYINDDWDSGVEPANNDIVDHTAVAGLLTVDARAYAGTLNIAHAAGATVSVRAGGRLTVRDTVSIGATGVGALNLIDGTLTIKNKLAGALSIGAGKIDIAAGRLIWAGDHVSDIQYLHDSGALTFSRGQPARRNPLAKLIGKSGPNELFAWYDEATGNTSVWVASSARPAMLSRLLDPRMRFWR